jgi:hypothetical protein
MNGSEILKIEMQENDANAKTIGDYLKALLRQLWREGEGFSGKRPFGNSGWDYDLYKALARAGAISFESEEYEDGHIEYYEFDTKEGAKLIYSAIEALAN